MVCREQFIYEKTKTITSELCDDIITIFKTEVLNNNCIVCNNETLFDIEKHPSYIRINNILGIEILKLYRKYISIVDSYINENIRTNIHYIFNIKKFCYWGNDIVYINNNRIIKESNRLKILNFIFFLNDYDGEYIFLNNYSIKPKKGSVIIFPVSMHYLYTERIKLFESKYIIEGFVYI